MKPLVSVVIPAYNGQRFIAAALDSVREQGDESIELVIVNDGSTDRTPEIVREFAKVLPIRVMNPGRMGNWVAATNLGLREAGGEWACFLHQDDLWLPNRMARLRRAIETAEGALILHNAMFVDQNGRRLGPWTCPLPEGVVPPQLFLERLLIQNFIAIPSPIFRRKVVIESGGLDESLWFSADWDLWLRLGAVGPVCFIPETLSAFRVHPSSQTSAHKLLPEEWSQQLTTVLARHLPNWKRFGKNIASVERAAKTSITVNAALAAASRGEPFKPWPPFLDFIGLGPSGWHRYLRDSRIVQRLGSRLRARWKAKFVNTPTDG
jgi:GT2 family glycosyltransferase